MSFFQIKCCNKSHKAKVFLLQPRKGYKDTLFKIAFCPICKRTFAVLQRTSLKTNKVSYVRAQGYQKVFKYLKALQAWIITEIANTRVISGSSFYLNYNEYGKKKKCYSNLSSLKLGLIKSNFEDIKLEKNYITE